MAGFVKNVLQYVQKGQPSDPDKPDKLALRRTSTAGEHARIVRKQLSLNFRWHARVAAIDITHVDIYYGSLTGTAERYAMRLGNDIAARGLNVTVQNLDTFDPEEFTRKDRMTSTRAFVFVASTHFAGSAPPTAEKFYEWLQFPFEITSSTSSSTDPEARNADADVPSSTRTSSLKLSSRAFSSRAASILRGMQYAVFGIGDSKYLTYNAVGKFMDVKLQAAGATRVLPLGLADISKNADAVFVEWEHSLFKIMPTIDSMPLDSSVDISRAELHLVNEEGDTASPIQIQESGSTKYDSTIQYFSWNRRHSAMNLVHDTENFTPALSKKQIMDVNGAPVRLCFKCQFIEDPEPRGMPIETTTFARLRTKPPLFKPGAMIQTIEPRLSADTSKNEIALLKLQLMDPELTYDTGDTFAYFPPNSEEQVIQIAVTLRFDLDSWFQLEFEGNNAQQLPFPTPCTVRTALTEFLEMRTVSREFVRVASRFVSEEGERDVLEHLASADGCAAFHTQFVEQHKCISDLIALAPSLKLPFEVFVCIAPLIKPRLYSIVSSPRVSPRTIDVAISLGSPENHSAGKSVSYMRHLMHSHQTGHGTLLRAFVIPTPFKLPTDVIVPIIMITHGIGVGLMRALLLQRENEWNQLQSDSIALDTKCSTNLVFLGCSNPSSLLFKHEFELWESNGFIQRYMAYSAEPSQERQLVQQVVSNHIETIFEIMSQSAQARIYVCGGLQMTRSIRGIMQGHADPNWFASIVSSGRYIEDSFFR